MAFSGHKTPSMLKRYHIIALDDLRRAAELEVPALRDVGVVLRGGRGGTGLDRPSARASLLDRSVGRGADDRWTLSLGPAPALRQRAAPRAQHAAGVRQHLRMARIRARDR